MNLASRPKRQLGTVKAQSRAAAALLLVPLLGGCAVVAVADAVVGVGAAAVSIAATTVKVGAKAVGAAVDAVIPDGPGKD